MSTLNRSYFILGFVSLTLLGTGCQKAASSGVRAKKGVISVERSQDDAKIEKLVKAGKSAAVCDKAIIEKYMTLKTEINATMTEIESLKKNAAPTTKTNDSLKMVKQVQHADEDDSQGANENGLSAEAKKSLLDHSRQIKDLTHAVIIEFVNKDIASCGKDQDLIGVENIQKSSNQAYVTIAEARGEDTPDSLSARAGQAKKEENTKSDSESLVGQKLKAKKELINVLDEQNQANSLFVTQGQKGSVLENYQIALNDSKNGVCLLDKAPAQKLKEDAVITILKTDLVTSESLSDSTNKNVTQKTYLNLLVRLGSEDQFFTFNCRLKADVKIQSAAAQFYEIFGSLLTKEVEQKKDEAIN